MPRNARPACEYYEQDFAWEMVQSACQQEWQARGVQPVNQDSSAVWDELYHTKQDKMFKPRRYLLQAFPEIQNALRASSCRIVDMGCGTGASLLPILSWSGASAASIHILAFDLSRCAVQCLYRALTYDLAEPVLVGLEETAEGSESIMQVAKWRLVKENLIRSGISRPARSIVVSCGVWDVTAAPPPSPWANSLSHFEGDLGLLIFTLSAIEPSKQVTSLQNMVSTLRIGGLLLFRDYGKASVAGWQPELTINTHRSIRYDTAA